MKRIVFVDLAGCGGIVRARTAGARAAGARRLKRDIQEGFLFVLHFGKSYRISVNEAHRYASPRESDYSFEEELRSMEESLPPLLSAKEIAYLLDCHAATVYRLIQKGEIEREEEKGENGKTVRVSRASFIRFLDSHTNLEY